ncbi:MAG: potassium/proton antiporter [Trueperaceae bacterium]|nr:potassium/proton antiporter [Trueperaceae bacterium]
MPALVLFVAVGMLAGSSGPLGIEFEDYALSLNVGLLALAIILFSGGLDTRYRLFRAAVLPAGLLATGGVLLTAGILALLAWWLTPLDLVTSLLLGAVLGSTDAAATFAALRGRGLPGRLKAVLETESGTNDPVAIYLTMALVSMAGAGALGAFGLVAGVVLQLGLGALYGWAAGKSLVFLFNRVALDGAGLYPVMALAGGLLAYGLANVAYGNGFVTIYVMGLVLGNAHLAHRRSIAAFMDGAAWGAQVLMFVLLGLLSFPDRLGASLPAAIVITLAFAFVARPVAVTATLGAVRLATRGRYAFSAAEVALLSWAGLKGAVPIILAILPLLAAVPGAEAVFDVVFVVVILGTTLQGATIAPLARWLGLERSEPPRPPVTLEPGGAAPVGAAVFDVYLDPDRRAVGRRLGDLDIPDDVVVAGILRDGKLVTPRGGTVFLAGDHVYLISGDADTVGIPSAFSGRRPPEPEPRPDPSPEPPSTAASTDAPEPRSGPPAAVPFAAAPTDAPVVQPAADAKST